MAIKRILIPVDFSDDSLKALAVRARFCQAVRRRARACCTWSNRSITPRRPTCTPTSPNIAMLIDEQRRVGAQQLARINADLKKKGERVRTLQKTGSRGAVASSTPPRA